MKRYTLTLDIEVADDAADDLIRNAKNCLQGSTGDRDQDWATHVEDGDPLMAAVDMLFWVGELDDTNAPFPCKGVTVASSSIEAAKVTEEDE